MYGIIIVNNITFFFYDLILFHPEELPIGFNIKKCVYRIYYYNDYSAYNRTI